MERCRRALSTSVRALKRNSRDALKLGERAETADEDERAGIALRLTAINASTAALSKALAAIRGAAEYAIEAEKLDVKRALVSESRAQREADGAGVH